MTIGDMCSIIDNVTVFNEDLCVFRSSSEDVFIILRKRSYYDAGRQTPRTYLYVVSPTKHGWIEEEFVRCVR